VFLSSTQAQRCYRTTPGTEPTLGSILWRYGTRDAGDLLDPRDGPLWWRGYARPRQAFRREEQACAEVEAALGALDPTARRMAVGHNIVPWVSSRCGGTLALLDVGMSSAYGGLPAAWRRGDHPRSPEITRDRPRWPAVPPTREAARRFIN